LPTGPQLGGRLAVRLEKEHPAMLAILFALFYLALVLGIIRHTPGWFGNR
jgi:hypothetical protein